MEIPNLRQRAWQHVSGRLRWLLWGAPRPPREARGRFLLYFGIASWLFSLVFIGLMLWFFSQYLWPSLGWLGIGAVTLLGFVTTRGMFQGLSGGEVGKMIT